MADLHKLDNTLTANAHIAALMKQVELLVKAQVKRVNVVHVNLICEIVGQIILLRIVCC